MTKDRHTFTLTLESGEEIVGDELLVAVGRTPHTGDLGLETVDLAPGETIAVDDRMRVPVTMPTGCTRSATSTAARSSPRPPSTRRRSPARRS